jgi:hypothetical protein
MSENPAFPDQDTRKTRVKFGSKQWQTVPHECAEWMLIQWKTRDPKRFGEMLRNALMRDE